MKKIRNSLLLLAALLSAAFCLALCACGGKITLSFVTNGGLDVAAMEVESGGEYTLPEPTRDGYTFEGWYADETFSGSPVVSYKAEENATFYAKWTKNAQITLDLAGGSLDGPTSLSLKAGENLYEFMKSVVPVKADSRFGMWLLDGKELSASATMPAEGVTLVARYKTAYTVEIYEQTLAQDGYERGEDVVGYEYAGTEFAPAASILKEGFTLAKNDASVETKVISETAADNVFRLWYDRKTFMAAFVSNYPAQTGREEETVYRDYVYGDSFAAPHDIYRLPGYCFLGWAETADGEVRYHTDYIQSRLYGAEGGSVADTVSVGGDVELYAVWVKAYLDLFRGEDSLYLLPDEPGVAYLQRADVFFKGDYNENRKEFCFFDADGEAELVGKVISDGVFAFSSDLRADAAYTLYSYEESLREDVKLYFDAYNGVIYSAANSLSHGTYVIDDNGLHVATFTDGDLAGRTVCFLTSTIRTQEGERYVFLERNEEEYAYGEMVSLSVQPGGISYFRPPYYTVTFDGFGIAQYVTPQETQYYYYVKNGENYDLLYSDRTVFLTLRIEDLEVRGYWTYQPLFDGTYSLPSGGTLELNGFEKAVYSDGNGSSDGYFMIADSEFGQLVRVVTEKGAYTFRATGYTDAEGQLSGYRMEPVPNSYAEFQYTDGSGIYYAPLLVLDETEEGVATLYGRTASREYAAVARGSYLYDETTGSYLFTGTEFFEADVSSVPIDLSSVKAFCFGLGTRTTLSGVYNVMYWYWMTTEEEVKTEYTDVYTSEDGATVTLVGGFAVYRQGDDFFCGLYSSNDRYGVISVTTTDGTALIYVELDEETHTFVLLLDDMIGTAFALTGYGVDSAESDTLFFDGKGGVEYTVTGEEEGESKVYYGVSVETDRKSLSGAPIYTFRAEGITFDYILLYSSTLTYFARFSDDFHGEYRMENSTALLELDGFGYRANYISADGTSYTGSYTVSDGVVQLILEEGYIAFNLDGEMFTVRGAEYGTYVLVDNGEIKNLFFSLNGYGVMSVLTVDPETSEVTIIDGAGNYFISSGKYVFRYTDNGIPVEVSGLFGYVTQNGSTYHCVIADHPECVRSYVNEDDLSVLVLDGYGTATEYGPDGTVENGHYVLITENLLYFTNGNLEDYDGCIYRYDIEKGTATPIRFRDRGYYTADLETMRFSRYGTMTVEGTSYYYSQSGNVITIYRRFDPSKDAEGAANRYGFVAEEFGEFTNEKTYGGKTYYVTSGYSIQFDRLAENAEKYPVSVTVGGEESKALIRQLSFAPTGSGSFSVEGTVLIGEHPFDCTVIRSVAEDGTASLCFVVQNFRFDIRVHYTGDRLDESNGNTYEITGMRSEISMLSDTFMTLYLFYYMMGGIILPNTFGVLTIVKEYNEAGEVTSDYVQAAFGPDSGLYDAKGELLSLDHAAYLYDEETHVYTVTVEGGDGYRYLFRFVRTGTYAQYGAYTYQVVAYTRVQTLQFPGGYALELERIISSDRLAPGQFYSVPKLTLNGEEVAVDEAWRMGTSQLYLIKRHEDGTATYYVITLAEKLPETVDGEAAPGYAPYESMFLLIRQATTYTASEGCFADISGEDVLMVHYSDEEVYIFTESDYDAESGTYTATTSSGLQFHIKISEDGVTIEKIEPSEE